MIFQTSKLYEVLHVPTQYGNICVIFCQELQSSTVRPVFSPHKLLKIKIICTSVIQVQLIRTKQLSIFKTVRGVIRIIARGTLLAASIFP